MKFLEERETTDPHIKLANIQLPNNLDEGDLKKRAQSKEAKENFDMEKKIEAILLLRYHSTNHHINPNYVLPPILKPTSLQLSTPHDIGIDIIPWASIREKVIQMNNIDLHNLLIDLSRFMSPEGADVNSERSWILTEPFFIRYPQLADADLLENMNRQRVLRDEEKVTMDDVWQEHQKFTKFTQAKLKEISQMSSHMASFTPARLSSCICRCTGEQECESAYPLKTMSIRM